MLYYLVLKKQSASIFSQLDIVRLKQNSRKIYDSETIRTKKIVSLSISLVKNFTSNLFYVCEKS